MSKRILIINLGWEQVPLIERIIERKDCSLYGVHFDDEPYCQNSFEEILTSDIRDLEKLFSFANRISPDAVISDQCDYSLFAQAVIADSQGLPGPTLRGAQISNNKYLQRETAKAGGVLIPQYSLCFTHNDVSDFADKVGYPIIVKPTDNRGSFGVVKVTSEEMLVQAFFTALVNSHSRCVLAEEFIDGQQITVDGYVFPGLGCKSVALGTKLMAEEGTQVALGISYPGQLAGDLFDRAMALNESVNERLGFKSGMTHTEYMIRDGEIYLIESANRGGGVYTSELIAPESSGIDLLSQYINDCLGESIDLYQPPTHQPVVLRFFSFRPGKVVAVHNWDRVVSDPQVMAGNIMISPGDQINPVSNDANRHGYLIVRGEPGYAEKLMAEVEVEYA